MFISLALGIWDGASVLLQNECSYITVNETRPLKVIFPVFLSASEMSSYSDSFLPALSHQMKQEQMGKTSMKLIWWFMSWELCPHSKSCFLPNFVLPISQLSPGSGIKMSSFFSKKYLSIYLFYLAVPGAACSLFIAAHGLLSCATWALDCMGLVTPWHVGS